MIENLYISGKPFSFRGEKMRLNSKIGLKAYTLVFSFLFLYTAAVFAAESTEVVLSTPLETTLSVSGIRPTAEIWKEMINSAQTSIDIEQFYISDQQGEALEPILIAVKNAAARNVAVRILIDLKFYATYPEPANGLGKIKNITVKTIDFSKLDGVQHAKFFVIDRKMSFVGSQNFDWRALSHIHEVGLKIDNTQIAADLERVFEKDWATASSQNYSDSSSETRSSDLPIQVLASPKSLNPSGIPDSESYIVSKISQAKTEVKIQVMEFSSHVFGNKKEEWLSLEKAMQTAANQGAKVKLLVDLSNLKKAKDTLTRLSKYKNIEVKFANIPEWSGGKIEYGRLIHSKYLVVDHQYSWVGSENWSKNYFYNSRNVGIGLDSSNIARSLDSIFDRIWSSSYVKNL